MNRSTLCLAPLLIALSVASVSYAEAPTSPILRKSSCLERVLESFPMSALREASGLIRSPFKRFVYTVSRGKIYKSLAPYFGKRAAKDVISVNEANAAAKLLEVDQAMIGGGFPNMDQFREDWFQTWKATADSIAEKVGVSAEDVSDLVAFHRDGQIAFVKKGDAWFPVELKVSKGSGDGSVTLLSDQGLRVSGDRLADLEIAVRNFAKKRVAGDVRVRKINPASNDLRYARDALFEWDGEIVKGIKDSRGLYLPELQELNRTALREGLAVTEEGKVVAIPEVADTLRKMYEMSAPKGRAGFGVEFQRAMERSVYHDLVYRLLGKNDEAVLKFLNSAEYEKFALQFVDRHIGYVGATQYEIAQAMLAEMALYQFERRFQGVTAPGLSYSQKFLANVPGYHDGILHWMAANLSGLPEDIAGTVRTLGNAGAFRRSLSYTDPLKEMVGLSTKALRTLAWQKNRQPTHQMLTRGLKRAGMITDERRSISNNVIANFGLGKAKIDAEDIYTISAFLDPQRVHGYIGSGKGAYRELLPFKPMTTAVNDSDIAGIFRKMMEAKNFGEERDLIEQYAAQLSAVLLDNKHSPEVVKKFATTLFGDRLAETLILRLHDPNVVSRFYSESYAEFEKMARYRYLFDLVHGLTTELVKKKLGLRRYVERSLGGRWKAYSFGQLTDQEILSALDQTLNKASDRLRRLRQEHVAGKTLVDWREDAEVWFGWDTYDMTFLRHYQDFDEYDGLGSGWACICFVRKSVFNSSVLRQF